MPVKVFNETFGRDEESVFGGNTTRNFGTVEVPSVEDFAHLTNRIESVIKQQHEILQQLQKQSQTVGELSSRMVDRGQAQMLVTKIKTAMADTSVFTTVLYSTLDAHEKRLTEANLRLREETLAFCKQAETAAQISASCLTDYRTQTATNTQALESKMEMLTAMLKESSLFQVELRTASQNISQNSRWQTWGEKMQQGGLWVRLKWLLFGLKN